MANKVLKELAIAVSSYEDRNTGQTKNRYENIGVLMQSENDRGERNTYIMLKRSFNPAGVPFKQGSDKILISLFDPRPTDQGEQGQRDDRGQDQRQHNDGLDESEIPF
ncbi:hypothetical protein ACHFJ0_04825 [Paracoccus sp. NGMCC 1.201697]|uniref:Single-stranded DNA-binding protein n=1 Tax=Paracoccus broussonetiae subsp. drimophilus TaxID=3373869 RepID=A0ABW7LHB4_9RHOB